jgi:hypothetical protein
MDNVQNVQKKGILPPCIENIIDSADPDIPVLEIRTQTVGAEVHYWIFTGINALDGNEYIVDENCNTLCVIRGWFYDPCIAEYNESGWLTVWEN